MTGRRGAQPGYSDVAIETVRTLRLRFRLPLRHTEGFLHVLLPLMDVTLPCPDHTTLSRRNATVAIRRQDDQAPRSRLYRCRGPFPGSPSVARGEGAPRQ